MYAKKSLKESKIEERKRERVRERTFTGKKNQLTYVLVLFFSTYRYFHHSSLVREIIIILCILYNYTVLLKIIHVHNVIINWALLGFPELVQFYIWIFIPYIWFIGYSIEPSRIGFNVTSYPPARDAPGFIECAKKSLDDMYEVLEGRNPRKAK